MIAHGETRGSKVNFDAVFAPLAALDPGEIIANPLDALTEQERQKYHKELEDIADKQVWPLVYSALAKTTASTS